jgi:hypothetical protein
MVRTGARAAVLLDTLTATGLVPLSSDAAPPRPTLGDLPDATAAAVLDLYRSLGGIQIAPNLRPGRWDLHFREPLLVELDEELHFNRYRSATLAAPWEADLPWTVDYRRYCAEREGECISAGSWGRRWTNDSAARMFRGGPPPDLEGDGPPRWKQRALYDSIKDTLPLLPNGGRLARVSTYDTIDGLALGAMLDGFAPVDEAGILALVQRRTA